MAKEPTNDLTTEEHEDAAATCCEQAGAAVKRLERTVRQFKIQLDKYHRGSHLAGLQFNDPGSLQKALALDRAVMADASVDLCSSFADAMPRLTSLIGAFGDSRKRVSWLELQMERIYDHLQLAKPELPPPRLLLSSVSEESSTEDHSLIVASCPLPVVVTPIVCVAGTSFSPMDQDVAESCWDGEVILLDEPSFSTENPNSDTDTTVDTESAIAQDETERNLAVPDDRKGTSSSTVSNTTTTTSQAGTIPSVTTTSATFTATAAIVSISDSVVGATADTTTPPTTTQSTTVSEPLIDDSKPTDSTSSVNIMGTTEVVSVDDEGTSQSAGGDERLSKLAQVLLQKLNQWQSPSQLPARIIDIPDYSKHPLSPTHVWPVRIGSLTFPTLGKAYQYVRARFFDEQAEAAWIKLLPNGTGLSTTSFASVDPAKETEWTRKVRGDVLCSLFGVKAEQCHAFREFIENHGSDVIYAYLTEDKSWGIGNTKTQSGRQSSVGKSIAEWSGRNNYGDALSSFARHHIKAKNGEKNADNAERRGGTEGEHSLAAGFCWTDAGVDPWLKRLVVGDLQLKNIFGLLGTDLVRVGPRTAVDASDLVKALAQRNLAEYSAVLLVITTGLIDQTPQEIKAYMSKLLGHLKQSCDLENPPNPLKVFVTGVPTRFDEKKDKVASTNAAIESCVLEASCIYINLQEGWPEDTIDVEQNGSTLSHEGKKALAFRLASRLPFFNLSVAPSLGTGAAASTPAATVVPSLLPVTAANKESALDDIKISCNDDDDDDDIVVITQRSTAQPKDSTPQHSAPGTKLKQPSSSSSNTNVGSQRNRPSVAHATSTTPQSISVLSGGARSAAFSRSYRVPERSRFTASVGQSQVITSPFVVPAANHPSFRGGSHIFGTDTAPHMTARNPPMAPQQHQHLGAPVMQGMSGLGLSGLGGGNASIQSSSTALLTAGGVALNSRQTVFTTTHRVGRTMVAVNRVVGQTHQFLQMRPNFI